jgi:hypothetical protein
VVIRGKKHVQEDALVQNSGILLRKFLSYEDTAKIVLVPLMLEK